VGLQKFLISLPSNIHAFGEANGMNHSVDFIKLDLSKTYSLVQVDCVFTGDDIGDG
jgi:hypothetical protein